MRSVVDRNVFMRRITVVIDVSREAICRILWRVSFLRSEILEYVVVNLRATANADEPNKS
jgi:hypothetical protein